MEVVEEGDLAMVVVKVEKDSGFARLAVVPMDLEAEEIELRWARKEVVLHRKIGRI
ncbi:MAG: hypothetical protein RMM17_02310 [Acidobacteriota bacterium]|nr:hypothetical protein [Blastocatellia bacterium]MDW8411503.1 hypothetical protein [Acidobacteriota bacterium]